MIGRARVAMQAQEWYRDGHNVIARARDAFPERGSVLPCGSIGGPSACSSVLNDMPSLADA